MRLNLYFLFQNFWQKNSLVQPIESFKKMFTKLQYRLTDIAFLENFDQKTIMLNPYCLFQNFWQKENMVQHKFSFSTVLTKRQYGLTHAVFKKTLTKTQYGSTHIVFKEIFDEQTIWLYPPYLLREFWPKDIMAQPILPFQKTLN